MGAYFYLGTSLVSLANGAVMFAVNPGRAINRVYFFASLWIALWAFCVFVAIQEGAQYSGGPAASVLLWLRLSSAVAAFAIWLIFLMRSVLLVANPSMGKILKESWFWLCVSCLVAALSFSEAYIPSNSTPYDSKRGLGYYVYSGATISSCVYFLYDTIRQMRFLSGTRKIEMQFFVFNTICACVVVVSVNLVADLLELPWLRRIGPVGFIALHALTVWALCYHKVFDAKQVIYTIAQRAAFVCILGCGAVVVGSGLKGYVDHPFDILLAALFTGMLAIAFERPTRKWFGLDPYYLLIPPRRAIIECARHEPDAEKLKVCFETIMREWCQASDVELLSEKEGSFIGTRTTLGSDWPVSPSLFRNGWLTPEFLQRKRPDRATDMAAKWMFENACGALLAVPRGSDHPSLLVVIKQRESLRPYTYPDIQLIFPLAELMDNILTHATLAQHAAKIAQMESAALISRSLAHDLNNLTTPVAAYLVHAEGRAKPGSVEAEVYEAALDSVKVMNEYICESLFFSRRLVPELKMMSPRESLASILRIAQDRAATRRIALTSRCEEGIRFLADPVLFQRLALNLINNAIDASPDQSSVMVSIDRNHSEQICLRVADQGAGIPSENLKRIFDPYFTTKNTGDTGRGLGLGLAICRKIVDLHGGDIEVDSSPGRGSVFTAIFPRLAKLNYLPASDTESSRERKPAGQPQAVIGFA